MLDRNESFLVRGLRLSCHEILLRRLNTLNFVHEFCIKLSDGALYSWHLLPMGYQIYKRLVAWTYLLHWYILQVVTIRSQLLGYMGLNWRFIGFIRGCFIERSDLNISLLSNRWLICLYNFSLVLFSRALLLNLCGFCCIQWWPRRCWLCYNFTLEWKEVRRPSALLRSWSHVDWWLTYSTETIAYLIYHVEPLIRFGFQSIIESFALPHIIFSFLLIKALSILKNFFIFILCGCGENQFVLQWLHILAIHCSEHH